MGQEGTGRTDSLPTGRERGPDYGLPLSHDRTRTLTIEETWEQSYTLTTSPTAARWG